MAEKRMITRDIFESSVMHSLSAGNPDFELEAQRVWEALILIADDWGRGRLIYQNIRIKAFCSAPNRYDKVPLELIEKWVKEIEGQKAIQIYEVDGDKYFYLTGWDKYQSGKWHKRNSMLPPPPGFPSRTSKKSPDKAAQVKGSKGKENIKSNVTPKKSVASRDKKELIKFCREIVPLKCSSPAQINKQVDALEKLTNYDKSKLDPECLYSAEAWKIEVFAVLRFARADTEGSGKWSGWSKNFQSIPRLREDGCDKYINIRVSYLDRQKRSKGGSGKKIDDPGKFKKTGKTQL